MLLKAVSKLYCGLEIRVEVVGDALSHPNSAPLFRRCDLMLLGDSYHWIRLTEHVKVLQFSAADEKFNLHTEAACIAQKRK